MTGGAKVDGLDVPCEVDYLLNLYLPLPLSRARLVLVSQYLNSVWDFLFGPIAAAP